MPAVRPRPRRCAGFAASERRAAYIDTSALVKLFKREPETDAPRHALGAWPVHVSSELIRVEAICTARGASGTLTS